MTRGHELLWPNERQLTLRQANWPSGTAGHLATGKCFYKGDKKYQRLWAEPACWPSSALVL
jgi:hypothetical protein